MMKFTLVLLAIVALQQATCDPIISSTRREMVLQRASRSILDTAQQKLSEMIKAVTTQIDKAVDGVEKYSETIVEDMQLFAEKAVAEVSKIVDSSLTTINVAIQSVIDLGLDPTKCIGNVISVIEGLKDKYVNGIGKCVTDRIPDVNELIKKVTTEVRAINNDLIALNAELLACKGGFLCLTSFIAKLGVQAFQIPLKITTLVGSCTKNLVEKSLVAFNCITKEAAPLAKELGGIVTTTVKCLLDQIPKPNETKPTYFLQ